MVWNNQIKSHWMLSPYTIRTTYSIFNAKSKHNFECKIMCDRFDLCCQFNGRWYRMVWRTTTDGNRTAQSAHTYYIMETNKSDKWRTSRKSKIVSFFVRMRLFVLSMADNVHHSNYHFLCFELSILKTDSVRLASVVMSPILVANNCFDVERVVCRKFYLFYPLFGVRAASFFSLHIRDGCHCMCPN